MDLRRERADGSSRRVEVPGTRRVRTVSNLTDREIEVLAFDESRQDVEQEINRYNRREALRRYRAGVAH